MTTNFIEPVRAPLGAQLPAFTAGAILAAQHPSLPGGYIIVHSVFERLDDAVDEKLISVNPMPAVDILLEDFSALEAWRDALEADPSAVDVAKFGNNEVKLEFLTTVAMVVVRVYAVGLVPTVAYNGGPLVPQVLPLSEAAETTVTA